MECVLEKVEELTVKLNDLTPGSEEMKNLADTIKSLTEADSNLSKSDNDAKYREAELKASKTKIIVDILGIASTIIVGIVPAVFKRITNKDVLSYEKTDYVNSRAFDNK